MVLELFQEKDKYRFDKQINIISNKVKEDIPQRVIGIVSGKGGVGKTVVTLNLGLAMNSLGSEVTLVDADVTSSNLGMQIGTYSYPTTLQDVLNKNAPLEKATYVTSAGLMIIPSSVSVGDIRARLSNLKKTLKSLSGLVLVDSPPGMDNESMAVLGSCDEIIVVATPDLPSVINATKVVSLAKNMKKEVLGIIINRHKNDRYDMKASEIELMAEVPVIGRIPEEKQMRKSIFHKMPILMHNPYSPASVEFYHIASHITKKHYNPPKFHKIKNILRSMKT